LAFINYFARDREFKRGGLPVGAETGLMAITHYRLPISKKKFSLQFLTKVEPFTLANVDKLNLVEENFRPVVKLPSSKAEIRRSPMP